MNARYSIRREEDGPAFIGGAPGVAVLGGVLGVLAGLIVPMALIEAAAFQLYLDRVVSVATPPLGTTARLAVMLLLGSAGAVLAYIVARWRRVQPLEGGIRDLLVRLRGVREDEDEDDAPRLRTLDRHPDAPARRPFSAARDIPEEGWAAEWQPVAEGDELPEDGGELLLDASSVLVEEPEQHIDDDIDWSDAAFAPVDTFDHTSWTEPFAFEAPETAELHPAESQRFEALIDSLPQEAHGNAIDDYDLAPPTLSDWEARPQPLDGNYPPAISEPVYDPIPVAAPVEAAEPPSAARVTPPPLDLSVARLDELIARLEAGLTRQPAAAAPQPALAEPEARPDSAFAPDVAPPLSTPVSGPGSAPASAPQADNDPAFPHDPALAAALRTLRRMNAAAG